MTGEEIREQLERLESDTIELAEEVIDDVIAGRVESVDAIVALAEAGAAAAVLSLEVAL